MIRLCVSLLLLTLIAYFVPSVYRHTSPVVAPASQQRQLRRLTDTNDDRYSRLRPLREPCIVTLTEILYEDGHQEEPLMGCVLQGQDEGRFNDFDFRIIGVDANFAQQYSLESYRSTIFATGALIDDDSKKIYFPWNANVQIGEVDPRERRLVASTGNQTVLVIRIECNDSSVSASEANISESIFGNNIDVINYKSQTEGCSFDQQRVLKASDHITNATIKSAIGDDSVYTVQIDVPIINTTDIGVVLDAATDQFHQDFDVAVNDLADLVMLCFPPGMNKTWIGFATVNGWKSWYWDDWCTYPSVMMHEVGHNMGLGHSGVEGADSDYADQLGFMGFSTAVDEGPLRCYNAPKTYHLNWFPENHVDVECLNTPITYEGDFIGFVDRDATGVVPDDQMILRLKNIKNNSTDQDVYVNFNRATGFNEKPQAATKDKVIVTTTPSDGIGGSQSRRVAILGAGENYTSPGLEIVVDSIDLTASPARAHLRVAYKPVRGHWVCNVTGDAIFGNLALYD